jgi:hypothetical protein
LEKVFGRPRAASLLPEGEKDRLRGNGVSKT